MGSTGRYVDRSAVLGCAYARLEELEGGLRSEVGRERAADRERREFIGGQVRGSTCLASCSCKMVQGEEGGPC